MGSSSISHPKHALEDIRSRNVMALLWEPNKASDLEHGNDTKGVHMNLKACA